jgi:hypothetical protein
MSTKRDAGDGESVHVPLSAIYRQLDDHLGPDEAPYDVGAGLERLDAWMNEEVPESQSGSSVERLETERLARDLELIQLRTQVIERTASRRMRSSFVATGTVAFLSLLAGLGLLFGLPLVPVHAAVATVVTIGIIDALAAFAVAYMHRTTMKSMQGDMILSVGTGPASSQESSQDEAGGSRGSRRASAPDPPQRAASPRVELVLSKTSHRLLGVLALAGVLIIAAAVGYWFPNSSRSWVLLTVAGILCGLVLVPLVAVIIPAVWSRSPARRDSALQVLSTMLGLKVRVEEPHRQVARSGRKRKTQSHNMDTPRSRLPE